MKFKIRFLKDTNSEININTKYLKIIITDYVKQFFLRKYMFIF